MPLDPPGCEDCEVAEGGCMFVLSQPGSWHQAKQQCEAAAGRMITLDTEAKNDAAKNYLTKYHPGKSMFDYIC